MKDFLELAKDRYSVRKLESVQIPQADIDKIIFGLGGLAVGIPFYFLMKKQYLSKQGENGQDNDKGVPVESTAGR